MSSKPYESPNYKTTLASVSANEHEGLGGFFDEVYVKDAEGFVVAKFYGPCSWGLARKFMKHMDEIHALAVQPDMCYMYGIPIPIDKRTGRPL